jgi:rfaE bifunctional protein nucleotidyltransferase chain/domain
MITVWTNGCFDVLHAGHFEFLRRCQDLGDRLVVGLNSDESVRTLKGPPRPIHNLEQRYNQLASIRWVDQIVVFHELTPCRAIQEIRPQICVKGPGYDPRRNMPEASVIQNIGGKVVILDGPDLSTTKILELLAAQ